MIPYSCKCQNKTTNYIVGEYKRTQQEQVYGNFVIDYIQITENLQKSILPFLRTKNAAISTKLPGNIARAQEYFFEKSCLYSLAEKTYIFSWMQQHQLQSKCFFWNIKSRRETSALQLQDQFWQKKVRIRQMTLIFRF